MSNTPLNDLQAKQRLANRRMGLIMGSIAVALFIGVIAKRYLFGA